MEKGGVSGREATAMTEHSPGEEGLALGDERLWTTMVPPPRLQRPRTGHPLFPLASTA